MDWLVSVTRRTPKEKFKIKAKQLNKTWQAINISSRKFSSETFRRIDILPMLRWLKFVASYSYVLSTEHNKANPIYEL